jgi:hypothetical protein
MMAGCPASNFCAHASALASAAQAFGQEGDITVPTVARMSEAL